MWCFLFFFLILLKDNIWGCVPCWGNERWRIPATGTSISHKLIVLAMFVRYDIYCFFLFCFRFMKWLWYQRYRKPKRIMFEALMTTWWKCWRFVFWLFIFPLSFYPLLLFPPSPLFLLILLLQIKIDKSLCDTEAHILFFPTWKLSIVHLYYAIIF